MKEPISEITGLNYTRAPEIEFLLTVEERTNFNLSLEWSADYRNFKSSLLLTEALLRILELPPG